ncbi:restriction endonuclease subunit S [Streptomyces afghaniensis]|uniref:restriction endonuclease subunit S n=1 Tax=Streptomyces afghaniensis TaxID=66865 RepID=UPI00278385E0|nr:restriction endonuclease subunit S [Streptomyces afghaniensis]MDQ1017279.1 type I restriction enzyme S subunit [Streptomyces afghaniensis]
MSNPSELPGGWAWATLDDLQAAEVAAMTDGPFGSNLKSSHYTDSGARVIRLQNIGDGRYIDEKAFISLNHFEELRKHEVRAGDLVIASLGNELPRACLIPDLKNPAIVKADCIRMRVHPEVDNRWLLYTLIAPQARAYAAERIRGVGRPRLGLNEIRRFPVPVPPIDEQRRIVAALEEQLSRLDAAIASVCAAKMETVRLLQSIYDDAASGRVADAWRDISDDVEVEGLRNGWVWRIPSDLTDGAKENIVIGPFGSNLKVSDYEDSGVPLVFVRNIRSGDFASTKYVSQRKAEELKSHSVKTGDLLITKMGEPPGDAAAYREAEDGIVTADCIRLRPSVCWDVDYLAVAVNSTLVRRQIEAATRGVAQRKVSLARFREGVKIPVPPESLQGRVMREVNDRVSKVRRLQEALDRAEKWAEALRRSLLAEAFAGRLVSQDPADEPANTLLARIRAEREEAGATKPRRRSPGRAPAQRKRTTDTAPAPDAPPSFRGDAPALATATQPTLDLEIPS